MRHLFIINPAAFGVKGRVNAVKEEIEAFFKAYSWMEYHIHVGRWVRDASGYARRYAQESDGLVRVHSFGGSGTLTEVINGVIGLPNVQVAAYPYGKSNDFIRYFGEDKMHLFGSLRSQVFSGVTPIDAIRCGNSFGISYGLVGLEAYADKDGTDLVERTRLPNDFCYLWAAFCRLAKGGNIGRNYRVTLDGQTLDGKYISIMVAGGPCYGSGMSPAVDAHPNDGLLDIYMVRDMPVRRLLTALPHYVSGNYRKIPDCISHYRGKKIEISSADTMCISVDGEGFYGLTAEYEIIPYAVDFVCPSGIDIDKLPQVYSRR